MKEEEEILNKTWLALKTKIKMGNVLFSSLAFYAYDKALQNLNANKDWYWFYILCKNKSCHWIGLMLTHLKFKMNAKGEH